MVRLTGGGGQAVPPETGVVRSEEGPARNWLLVGLKVGESTS